MFIKTKENYQINFLNDFVNKSVGANYNRTMAELSKYKIMFLICLLVADSICTSTVGMALFTKQYLMLIGTLSSMVMLIIAYGIGMKYPKIHRFVNYVFAILLFVVFMATSKNSDSSIIARFLNVSLMISIMLTVHISSFLTTALIYSTGFILCAGIYLKKYTSSKLVTQNKTLCH